MRQALFLSLLPLLTRGVLANTCNARSVSATSTAASAAATYDATADSATVDSEDSASSSAVEGDIATSAIGDGLFARASGSSASGDASAVTSTDSGGASAIPAATSVSSGASGDASFGVSGAVSSGVSGASSGSGGASSAASATSGNAFASSTSTADERMGAQAGTDLVLGEASDNCSCGYKISSLDNQYFPYKFSFAFSSVDDGDADALSDQKWVLNDGDIVGGAANGNRCWGRKDNIYIDGGDLVLKVPKNQTLSSNMSCAEIAFEETNITGGIFQTTAMLSGVDGTCQAFWLNHSIATQYADEVDIEVISSTIDTDGIWYSNWPPNGDPNDPDSLTSVHTNDAVPGLNNSDPRKTYNNYTIAWLDESTNRYYNGAKQDSPTDNQPEHSMIFVINNWSNGGSGWTLGPPTEEDSLLKVKSVLLYYKTANVSQMSDLGGDCQDSDVCTV
ncbi:hypothetical protein IAR50_007589 [Cryptococcus sp. DSM 104548]